MQRVFQAHVDNGVSKTINISQDETPATVLDLYLDAYKLGLKGTTVFRDKSREDQYPDVRKRAGMLKSLRREAAWTWK